MLMLVKQISFTRLRSLYGYSLTAAFWANGRETLKVEEP
jgi:hypothetical protein